MNKLSYLKRGKFFLRNVKRQREWLLKHNKGYLEEDYAIRELKNIDNALATIISSDQMKSFLQRKEHVIRILIPSTNYKRKKELQELLNK